MVLLKDKSQRHAKKRKKLLKVIINPLHCRKILSLKFRPSLHFLTSNKIDFHYTHWCMFND